MYRLLRPFKKSHRIARKLYPKIVSQARNTHFFEKMGVEDSFEGRFNILSLHLYLVLERLNSGRDEHILGQDIEQDLVDIFFDDMDTVIREMGTGDMGVGHKVKRLANRFYGRYKAYQQATDQAKFSDALMRNIYQDDASKENADDLAGYAVQCRNHLASQAIDNLFIQPDFPAPDTASD